MRKLNYFALLLFLYAGFLGCDKESNFQHEITGEGKPWSHDQFDATNEKFTFAIFSDLTGGERPGIFNVAIAQLNLLRPEMIINVGDLIEGDHTNLDQLNSQWNFFDERVDRARAPVFYVGGNHDLTSDEMWEVWDKRYGKRYYHFVYKNVLFLVLNTEDHSLARMKEIVEARKQAMELVDKEGWGVLPQTEYAMMPEQKAGNISAEQAAYFQKVIADHPDVLHTFLFMHKAAWKKEGEKKFLAIEKSLENRSYTVFNGHVHAYDYEERFGHDYIRLATTGGVHLPENGRSMDHVTLVTVDRSGVDIANVLLEGILDKKGQIPLGGDTLCFEKIRCADNEITN